MTALYIFAAVIVSLASSKLIDKLYSLPNAPLSFPEKIHGSKHLRKIFMATAMFAAMELCANMTALQAVYTLTATFFMVLITVTDFEQQIIFDKILMPFAIIGAAFTIFLELSIIEHLLAAIIGGGIFFALMMLTEGGIGGGDVKLIAVLGLQLGENLSFVVLSASIIGGIAALILLATGLKKRADFFAYGPYFCIATEIYLFNLC